jgi:hypothetical protein
MALNISNEDERNLLEIIRANWTVYIRLFVDNLTLDADTTQADLVAAEADYVGYAPQEITSWTAAATDADGRAYTLSGTVTFPLPSSGSQTIYGWFSSDVDVDEGSGYFANKYPAAINYTTGSEAIQVTVVFKLRQEPST